MYSIWQDIFHSFRVMRRAPLWSAAIVAVLALGLAANTSMFGAFHAWVLRPLDFASPGELVAIFEARPRLGVHQATVSPANLEDWRQQQTSFAGVAAFSRHVFNMHERDDPELVQGARVDARLFPLLGVEPVLGRGFNAAEDVAGRPLAVALISDDLWQRSFDRDASVIGRTVRLDGRLHEVIGVMKPGFQFPEWAHIWTPLGLDPAAFQRDQRWLDVVARLRSTVSLEAAQSEMTAVGARLEALYSETNTDWSVEVLPLRRKWAPPVIDIALAASLGAAFFVLLVICANVANLMLAQATVRGREMALRTALGAGRRRLIRQAVTECTVLALIGGLVGIPLAMVFNNWMLSWAPTDPPYLFAMKIEYQAILYTLAVALATGLVCGIGPVVRYTRIDVNEALKSGGGRLAAVRGGARARSALVVAELALSTALVIASVLMVKSFVQVQRVEPGYDPHDLLTMRLSLSGEGYRQPSERIAFAERALARVRALPVVRSAAMSDRLPATDGGSSSRVVAEGRLVAAGEERVTATQWIGGAYLQTTKIPLLSGRDFLAAEVREGAETALVSESLAADLWPDSEPLGRRLRRVSSRLHPWLTVVGVVGDVDAGERMIEFNDRSKAALYLPLGAEPPTTLSLAVRAEGEPTALAASLRTELRAADPGVPVYELKTMQQAIAEYHWVARFFGQLLAAYAAIALGIAALGAYGVTADLATQRRRELALRMALGARRGDLVRLVVREGGRMGALGVGIGVALALLLTRFGASMLVGVSAKDPFVFGGVAALLVLVSVAACLLPALRATAVDPMQALRSE